MPHVVPFRAWRYDLTQVDPLDHVIAPPYDVIGPDLQARLYERSPHNIVRVDYGQEFPSDDPSNNRHTRAAGIIDSWKRLGAVARDTNPGITVVEETFAGPDGRTRTRRGVLACLKLEEFGEGGVFPHEITLSGPKEDRFRLMEATEMSLSPIFLLYSLPGDNIMAAWRRLTDSSPVVTVTSEQGVVIRLWITTQPEILSTMTSRLAKTPLLIADGHHRYETALRYRDAKRVENPGFANGAWEYALVYLVNLEDPGLAIFGTHRLVKNVNPDLIAKLPQSLGRDFSVELLAENPTEAPAAVRSFLETHEDGPPAFGLYVGGAGVTYGLVLKVDPLGLWARAPGAEANDQKQPDAQSDAYRRLDVSVLQRGVLEHHLQITPEDITAGAHVAFFKETDEAFRALAAGNYQAGFFMNATKLGQVKELALSGERMPQKSTYFYPKLPTGLVFHDLHGSL